MATTTSDPPREGPREVLIVGDDSDLAENIAELLAASDRRMRIARTPEAAIAEARGVAFDVAIVDVHLPGPSGLELVTRLREVWGESEVILVTADRAIDAAIAAVKGGAYAFVLKPFDPGELKTLCARAIAKVVLRRERSYLQRELARSEALHRGVVDGVADFIVGLDAGGIVRAWNRPAARATGIDASEVIGRPLSPLFDSETTRARLAEALRSVIAGETVSDVELPVPGRLGERVVRWTFSPLDPGSEVGPLILAVGVDTTEQRDLEQRAAEAEALVSLGKLTAGLAHGIRNPLNAASLQLELINRAAVKLDPGEVRDGVSRRVTIVREELARLTHLLDDFLELARPRALAFEAVDVGALLTEVASGQEPVARAAGVTVTVRAGETGVRARASRAHLKPVLVNLVLNAIEAMRARGHGHVVLDSSGHAASRVEISVEDDGPGFASEMVDRAFEPFATTKEAGTGLGLTIVKRVVDRHGGTVHLGSRPGGGAVVRIHLDRA